MHQIIFFVEKLPEEYPGKRELRVNKIGLMCWQRPCKNVIYRLEVHRQLLWNYNPIFFG